jgi:hypothetical protein
MNEYYCKTLLMRMKKTIVLIVCLLAAVSAHTVHADAEEEIRRHEEFLRTQFPRPDGSAAEEGVIEYIREILDEHGIAYQAKDFDDFEEGHSFSRVIEATLPGDRADTLIIAVPLNHPYGVSGKEGGAVNLSLALTAAAYLNGRDLPVTVKLLFLGGEYAPEGKRQMGTKLFLRDYYPEHGTVVMYLRFSGYPEQVAVRTGGNGRVTPYWLINRCSASMESAGLSYDVLGNENQIYRLGISRTMNFSLPYLRHDLPALEFIGTGGGSGGTVSEAEKGAWVRTFFTFLDSFLEKSEGAFPEEWDRHYLYFKLSDFSFILPEGAYILFLIGLFTSFLILAIFIRKRIGRYRRILLRKSWALLLLFAMIFLFLFLATLIVRGVSVIRGYPQLWEQNPLLFFVFKIVAAFSFFFLMYRLVKRVPFPGIRSFYSASAIVFFLLLILITSVVNVSFSYYFVWALYWSVLFSLFQNRFAKLFCFLLSPALLIKGIYDLFLLGSEGALEFLIVSPLYGNLFFSLLILPFALMIIRVIRAFRDTAQIRHELHGWILYALPAASFVVLITYSFLFTPYTKEEPRIINVHETIDSELMERKLSIASKAPLGTVEIEGVEGYQDLDAGRTRSVVQYADTIPELVGTEIEEKRFLDRKYLTVTVTTLGEPVELHATVLSEGELILYDSNFPFSQDPEKGRAAIYIGAYPPDPLHLEIVIPAEYDYELKLETVYKKFPYSLSVTSENAAAEKQLTYITWVQL